MNPAHACLLARTAFAATDMPPHELDPRAFGALGDGQHDDTHAIQAALDRCDANGGGTVSLHRGRFLVRGTLRVPPYVTLRGKLESPAAESESHGTTFLACAGRGNETGTPFITLHTGSTLLGVAVHYPEQTGDPIVPYPYCVAGNGEDITITNCLLVNPYQGIDMGSSHCPRHVISRVYGYPLRRGLFVDRCFDIGRIENVHFWPFWRTSADRKNVRAFVQQHGEAFVFAMTDWQYVLNTFCWGYRVGYRFTENGQGVCNGNFLGIGADACNIAVQVDNCAAYGLLITNGEFVAIDGHNPTPIVVGPENSGTIQFNNCSSWGPCYQCAHIDGKGHVSFNQCHFLEWDSRHSAAPAIDVASGTFTLHASRFAKSAPTLRIGAGVRGAVVTGNLFASPDPVTVADGATATVEANGIQAPPEEPVAGSQVISVLGPGTRVEGEWWDYAGRGSYLGVAYFSVQHDEPGAFTWFLQPPSPAEYTLSAWIPRWVAPVRGSGEAHYRIVHANGEHTLTVSQADHAETWLPLGTFRFDANSYVVLQNAPDAVVLADCLLLTPTTTKR